MIGGDHVKRGRESERSVVEVTARAAQHALEEGTREQLPTPTARTRHTTQRTAHTAHTRSQQRQRQESMQQRQPQQHQQRRQQQEKRSGGRALGGACCRRRECVTLPRAACPSSLVACSHGDDQRSAPTSPHENKRSAASLAVASQPRPCTHQTTCSQLQTTRSPLSFPRSTCTCRHRRLCCCCITGLTCAMILRRRSLSDPLALSIERRSASMGQLSRRPSPTAPMH